ncbi:ABC-2 family transporter protein [Collinsella intestinalis]|nr:ABC-2 family transporter protein [Collinsella intestinalis]
MLSLIKFELKKMLTRRVAVAANAGAIVMLVAVMALNVMQARAEGNIGEILSGPEAIAHRREVAEARAGELTPERVAADIARYQEIAYERLNPEELAEMSDAAAYEAVAEAYDEATRLELYDPYYITLLKPWAVRGLEPYQYAFRVTPEMALDFYGALAASLQDSLDEGMGGEWVYSPAERAFWTEKEAGVAEPIGYGWSGGWDNILDCTAFLVFAIFAACVTVTPLFASEYREGTDAVLLSSLKGRGRLVAAKLAAAALYATALFAAGAAIVCGVSLAFYGAGGADLAIQNYALASPYNLTMAQATALYIGIFYLVMLGMLALTLALSASTPSTLAIIVTDVVVLFVTGLLPSAGVGVLRHILTLFPMGLQSPFDMFAALFSYPVGPVALDLIGMAALVYGALVAVGVPLALGRWRRHQVA